MSVGRSSLGDEEVGAAARIVAPEDNGQEQNSPDPNSMPLGHRTALPIQIMQVSTS